MHAPAPTPSHSRVPRPPPELLAPAGDFDCACAALAFGADAVYAGLSRFSARAEATNLSIPELRALVAHAHTQPRPRRVYVTLNTLIREQELDGVTDTLETLEEIGVDAVILQDLAVYRLARRSFPRLRLHASTQLAVHNLAGARALAELGFHRVVLARELTLDEVGRIGREAGVETEIFVHGALCYSYSGLCLFSSHQTGRSGNRGRCAYCCREPFASVAPAALQEPAPPRFPFSMRDLALAPLIPTVAATGVSSLKIEGRMKNATYVACVTDYYRRKLDGALTPEQEGALVQDLQTIFSRPWTSLYASNREAAPESIVDPATLGHRGAAIGQVRAVVRDAQGNRWIRFHTSRALEKHDGLQIDLPGCGRPFGFPVDALRRPRQNRMEVSLPAGIEVEAMLPADPLPDLPAGATVCCSASQAVRRRYQVQRPRPSQCRLTRPVRVRVTLRAEGISLAATPSDPPFTVVVSVRVPLSPARRPDQTAEAIRRSLARSGDTPWQVVELAMDDPDGRFVPASTLHDARRKLFDALTARHEAIRETRRKLARQAFAVAPPSGAPAAGPVARWTVKVSLAAPAMPALRDADEIVLQLGGLPRGEIQTRLATWAGCAPRERLRLALPLITRLDEEPPLRRLLESLCREGWSRWECADLGGWRILRDAVPSASDLTADWSLYGLNRVARGFLAGLGFARAVTSPEDTGENIAAWMGQPGPAAEVLVWQQTPLFLSETPPLAEPIPPGHRWAFAGRRGGRLETRRVEDRWVTVADSPFCIAGHIPSLRRMGAEWFRVDFAWSPPDAAGLTTCWNRLRAGKAPRATHAGNYLRGFQEQTLADAEPGFVPIGGPSRARTCDQKIMSLLL